jgi:hypothetical protein
LRLGCEQIEGGGIARQVGMGQVQVSGGGGADTAVAQQLLDGVQVDTSLEQMGGKGVPVIPLAG